MPKDETRLSKACGKILLHLNVATPGRRETHGVDNGDRDVLAGAGDVGAVARRVDRGFLLRIPAK